MLDFPTWKRLWFWGLTLVASLAALPSIFAIANLDWPEALPRPEINLGLDLAGGSHTLLEADSAQVAAQRLAYMEESVRQLMRRVSPRLRIGDVATNTCSLRSIPDHSADLYSVCSISFPLG